MLVLWVLDHYLIRKEDQLVLRQLNLNYAKFGQEILDVPLLLNLFILSQSHVRLLKK